MKAEIRRFLKWQHLLGKPIWTFRCDRCKNELRLFLFIDGDMLCPECWRKAGEPARYGEAATA